MELFSPLAWQIAIGIVLGAILVWVGRLIILGIVSCFMWISDEDLWGKVLGGVLFLGLLGYGLFTGNFSKTLRGVDALKKAVDLDPRDLAPRKRMAEVLSDLGEYDEAIECLRQGIPHQFWPAYQALLYVSIGDLYSKSKRNSEAMAAYNEALRLAPTLPEAHLAIERLSMTSNQREH